MSRRLQRPHQLTRIIIKRNLIFILCAVSLVICVIMTSASLCVDELTPIERTWNSGTSLYGLHFSGYLVGLTIERKIPFVGVPPDRNTIDSRVRIPFVGGWTFLHRGPFARKSFDAATVSLAILTGVPPALWVTLRL